MNARILLACLGFLCATLPIYSQESKPTLKEPDELTTLRSRYIEAIQTATKPIQTRYASELQALLKTFTQRGDVESAKATVKELGILLNAPSARFTGTNWRDSAAESRIEFLAAGIYRESWKGHEYTGTWKRISENEVTVDRDDNRSYRYEMALGGKALTRSDGIQWIPTK